MISVLNLELRFTIKGAVGNGWGFAFQPDFADGTDDSDDMQVILKMH